MLDEILEVLAEPNIPDEQAGGVIRCGSGYALAYLVVTSARDVIDNPLPMPADGQHFAGILM